MFGFLCANEKALNAADKKLYGAYYCGLCRALEKAAGEKGRLTLHYDMVFLALLLASLYQAEEPLTLETCGLHPVKKHERIDNEFLDYAAQMNLLLTYHKLLDDWQDDKSHQAKFLAKQIEPFARRAAEHYPRQAKATEDCLAALSQAEKQNETRSDIPAALFGRLLGEIFCFREDGYSDQLREFGFRLGKLIYIMDACIDLRQDLKKERYNPMVFHSTANFEAILSMLLAECTEVYESMHIERHKEILDNVLYSGVWSKVQGRGKHGKGSV